MLQYLYICGFSHGTNTFIDTWLWWPVWFGSHRTVINRERILRQLPPPGHRKRQQTQEFNLSVKEAYYCAIMSATRRAGFYLRSDDKPILRPWREVNFTFYLYSTPEHQDLPCFYDWCPGFCGCCLRYPFITWL